MGFVVAVFLFSLSVEWISGLGMGEGPCAHFAFPELSDTVSVIDALLNDTVILTFEISPRPGCVLDNEFTISVRVKDGERLGDFCSIRQKGGFCQIPLEENGCGCLAGKGKYQLKKTITRMDGTRWLLAASTVMVKERELEFNVIYPPIITNLSLVSDNYPYSPLPIVEPQTPVDVICRWQNGHPVVPSARLLDRRGVDMKDSVPGNDQITYRFTGVGCQDAGLIHCQAPGASQNMTATLLVKCKPEFDSSDRVDVTVGAGQNDLRFKVRTHTADILDCIVTSRTNRKSDRLTSPPTQSDGGQRSCRLSGTPPDLELTVRLDNVRKEEEGQWQLELTNDAGTGFVQFQLRVQEGTWSTRTTTTTTTQAVSTSEMGKTHEASFTPAPDRTILLPATLQTVAINQDSASVNWSVIGPSVGAGFVIVVVIVVVVVIMCRRKERAGVKRRANLDRQLPCVPVSNIVYHSGQEADRSSLLGEHDYVDIAEVQIMKSAAAAGTDDYLCPNTCSSARTGTYEHPSTSQDYVPPRPVYEPLRHLYDTFNQWRTKAIRRSAQM